MIDLTEVLPLVAERATAGDAGRLDDEVVAAIRATGFNRLLLPAELGGFEVSPRACVEAVEQLAAVDGSTGWAASIGMGSNSFAAYIEREAAEKMFVDPDATNAAMFAGLGQVDDGGRMTGRWPFASNCRHSTWIALGAFYPDDPVPRVVFVPMADVTIHETWDVAGMRGTGSCDVSVEDLAVDPGRVCRIDSTSWAAGTVWRLPMFVFLAPCLTAVLLGIARGAVDELQRQAVARRAQMRGSLLDDPVGLADLAAADTAVRSARAGLLAALDECWALAETGAAVDRPLQARTFLASLHAAEVSVDVTSTAHRLGGGAAAYNPSPLLRALRDVETARQHAVFNQSLRGALARIVAGLDEMLPPFVL